MGEQITRRHRRLWQVYWRAKVIKNAIGISLQKEWRIMTLVNDVGKTATDVMQFVEQRDKRSSRYLESPLKNTAVSGFARRIVREDPEVIMALCGHDRSG